MLKKIKKLWLKLGLPIYYVDDSNKYVGPTISKLTKYTFDGYNIVEPTFVNFEFLFLTNYFAKKQGIAKYKIFSWKHKIENPEFLDLADEYMRTGKITTYKAYMSVATKGVIPDDEIDLSSDDSVILRI